MRVCDKCFGEGLGSVVHLPNGDSVVSMCPVCDGRGVLRFHAGRFIAAVVTAGALIALLIMIWTL